MTAHSLPGPPVRRRLTATLTRVKATLRAALNAAVRAGYLAGNPVSHVQLPPGRRPRGVRLHRHAADKRHDAIVGLAFDRAGAIGGHCDVDAVEATVTVRGDQELLGRPSWVGRSSTRRPVRFEPRLFSVLGDRRRAVALC